MLLNTPNKLTWITPLCIVLVTGICNGQSLRNSIIPKKDIDWPMYASSHYSTKYADARMINASNFKDLTIAWYWSSIDQPLLQKDTSIRTWLNESTPTKIGNRLYTTTSLSQVAAIDAMSGKTIWQYDPQSWQHTRPPNMGFVNRGLAYWTRKKEERIYIGTGDGYLIALDCESGKPVNSFGNGGKIDLTQGLHRNVERKNYGITSPPLICKDVIIVGSSILDFPGTDSMPPGDVRGFDAATGKLLWTFESVPQQGSFGNNTWEDDSWKYTGNTNVWTWMSCDESLGYAYLPFSTPTNDFYGGKRHGDNLFGESIVCVDVKTGKRIWHYQTVHHGLWDYDLPAAPILADITISNRKRKILAQVTKQGFVFVLDRVTGKPIWPIIERPVPASMITGEKTSATQPFPTLPLPFDRQGIDTADLADFTPEIKKIAIDMLSAFDHGPLYTPPTEKGIVALPGMVGGGSWAGAALDPVSGILYVPSVTKAAVIRLFRNTSINGDYAGSWNLQEFLGPGKLPLIKPPYGRITAIDLKTGKHLWMTPVGKGPIEHPMLRQLGLKELGSPERNHILLTPTLLIAGQEGKSVYTLANTENGLDAYNEPEHPCLRAFDPTSGHLLGEIPLPANASGAPITYMIHGKQFIIVPVGGGSQKAGIVALTLPE